jgi:hypothetical protein
MFTLIKWIAATLFAGLVWLVGKYATEYFRPYNKK